MQRVPTNTCVVQRAHAHCGLPVPANPNPVPLDAEICPDPYPGIVRLPGKPCKALTYQCMGSSWHRVRCGAKTPSTLKTPGTLKTPNTTPDPW
jgi:hypothetical protein